MFRLEIKRLFGLQSQVSQGGKAYIIRMSLFLLWKISDYQD